MNIFNKFNLPPPEEDDKPKRLLKIYWMLMIAVASVKLCEALGALELPF